MKEQSSMYKALSVVSVFSPPNCRSFISFPESTTIKTDVLDKSQWNLGSSNNIKVIEAEDTCVTKSRPKGQMTSYHCGQIDPGFFIC